MASGDPICSFCHRYLNHTIDMNGRHVCTNIPLTSSHDSPLIYKDRIHELEEEVKRYTTMGHDHSTQWWQAKAEDAEEEVIRLRNHMTNVQEVSTSLVNEVRELKARLDTYKTTLKRIIDAL